MGTILWMRRQLTWGCRLRWGAGSGAQRENAGGKGSWVQMVLDVDSNPEEFGFGSVKGLSL